MKSLVVYFSKFGNTQKVAEAIVEELGSVGPVRVVRMDQLAISDLKEVDLVVAGSPTHRMKLPEDVRVVLEGLPRHLLRDTRIAVFDTSYKMSRWLARFTAAKTLSGKLRRLGGKRVVPPETFHVMDKEGPLYDSEIERAREWARVILRRLES